jgi:hypothetical protein
MDAEKRAKLQAILSQEESKSALAQKVHTPRKHPCPKPRTTSEPQSPKWPRPDVDSPARRLESGVVHRIADVAPSCAGMAGVDRYTAALRTSLRKGAVSGTPSRDIRNAAPEMVVSGTTMLSPDS